jgi:hypothetical protein
VKCNIFPAKFFSVPAQYENNFKKSPRQYENNVLQKFYPASIDAPYLLSYPNTRIQYGKIGYGTTGSRKWL